MCGRFSLAVRIGILADRFNIPDPPDLLLPSYNIAPSEDAPVIQSPGMENCTGDHHTLSLMKWGLVTPWTEVRADIVNPVNARAETLAEKPIFRDLLQSGRCIIPATGFYEWQKDGKRRVPWYISMKDESLFGIAGLCNRVNRSDGSRLASFTIITTLPNSLVAPLHDRMPAILSRSDEEKWLDPGKDILKFLPGILGPCPAGGMQAYEVSSLTNDPDYKGEETIRRVRQETLL